MQQTEKRTKGTVIVNQLSAIHRLEQKQGIRNSRKEEEDIQNYIRMKLLLRRFDFDLPENYEKEVYEYIIKKCRESVERVETGRFGADMKVSLLNDGPFTIVLDSEKL